MAQDIIITPRSGEPRISFTGSGTTASSINLNVLSDSTLSFEGTQGQLFSITNNLTSGVIFGVNDIGGLPLIEASANGNVSLVRYGNNVGIGTGSPSAKLDILETWNTSAVQTGIKLSVIDVSSNSNSRLLNIDVSGNTRLALTKSGQLYVVDSDTGNRNASLILSSSDRTVTLKPAAFGGNGAGLTGPQFYSTARNSDSNSVRFQAFNGNETLSYFQLWDDNQSDVLALRRNGDNPQAFRIYNTYTNASNYERAGLNWNASAFEIETEASGTGLARSLILGTSSIPRIIITSTGNQTYNASNTAAAFDVHTLGNYTIHNYAPGYVTGTPGNTITSSIRVVGYQATNSTIKTILEVKDYRNTHWNNLGSNNRSAGIGFLFENGNGAGTPIAEKYTAGIYAISEGGDRFPFTGLAFAANGLTEMMRLSNAGNLGIGTNAPQYRLHVAASSYPVLYVSGTTANASAQYVFQTNGKLLIGSEDGTFGEKIRFNNGYGIETFGGGGIRIRGGAYVTISDSVSYEGAHFSPGYFGSPSLSIRSKFENQVLLELQQQNFSTQSDDYFRIRKLPNSASSFILTVASSGWMGLGVSAPSAVLHVDSNSTQDVINLHSSGTTRFKINNNGQAWVDRLRFLSYTPGTYYFGGISNGWGWNSNGTQACGYAGDTFFLDNSKSIGWVSDPFNLAANINLILARDAAGILAQRNSTNAQAFRIYNTYTDASNYERAGLNWNASAFEIETEASGTGLARNLIIGTSGIPRIFVSSTGQIGIGTQTPTATLHVSGNTILDGSSVTFATDGSGGNFLRFYRVASNSWRLTSPAIGDIFRFEGNFAYVDQDLKVRRGGLEVINTYTVPAEPIKGTITFNDGTKTYTAFKLDVTDTSSAANSNLIDAHVSGVSKFKVDKYGSVSAVNYYNSSGALPTTISTLYDVSGSVIPAEGYILIYTSGKWVAMPPTIDGGSASG